MTQIEVVVANIVTEQVDAIVNAANSIAHVIHTVGPVWNGGACGEQELLESCYRRCLEVADELGATSVAFPAISTGVYGYPADLVAEIAVSTIRSASTKVELIRLVAFSPEAGAVLTRALGGAG